MKGDSMRHFLWIEKLPIFFAALLLMLCWPAQRVSAAIIAVDEPCSLHDAIVAANTDSPAGGCPAGAGADTIVLSEDVTLSEALPVIESVISIEGEGFSISGDGKFRIFDVDGGSLTIRQLMLVEGRLEERRNAEGGAIRLRDGARVTAVSSTFADNTAGTGGAIATTSWNNYLDVSDSHFVGNESKFGSGAIRVSGGTVNISNSSFNENSTRNSGGAIEALRGRLRVWNSTFSHNRGYVGGGIYVRGAEVSLTHLTLAENHSVFGGDSLFRSSGLLHLRNSIVSGDTGEDDCYGRLDQHSGNVIADWSCRAALGGNPLLGDYESALGIRPLSDGSPALDAADPEFCLATDQVGRPRPEGGGCDIGAIESTTAEPSSIPIVSTCSLAFQIIAANQDRWIGACPPRIGAVTIALNEDITLNAPLPRITSDITIEGNGHTISGANRFRIFDVDKGNLTIKDLTLANGNAKDSEGGAILLGYKAAADARNVIFENNSAKYGGAIHVGLDSELRISHSRFQGNAATYRGGAVNVQGLAEISHSVFSGNTAESDGGAILTTDQILRITNSTFVQNAADEGGAIYVDSSEVYLTHVTMIDNHGLNGGDAIHRGRRGWGDIHLRNSIIAGGSANADCRGYLDQNVANLIEDGSCLPKYQGEPLLNELPDEFASYVPKDGSPLINAADPRYCLDIDQNGKPRPFGAACDIGAIEATSDYAAAAAAVPLECSLHDRILAANTDSPVGGCPAGTDHDIIHIDEDIDLSEVLPAITGVITIEGGGHTISGNNQFRIFEVRGGNLTINNLTLADGYANNDGGALYIRNGSNVTVNDSMFRDNFADFGGAIHMEGRASTLIVNGSLFVQNYALYSGGAADLSGSRVEINSSSFFDNSSQENTAGALSLAGGAMVSNSHFIGNQAPSGGAMTLGRRSEIILSHLTMLDNVATEAGRGHAILMSNDESNARLFNSIIAGGAESGAMCHGQPLESSRNWIEDGSCEAELTGNPQFAGFSLVPLYLTLPASSPAIDAADPRFCPPTDQIGNPRPVGAGCDLGAIEFMGE